MIKEEWRKIEGFESYEVSNFGRVKSLERKVKRGNNFIPVKEKILKAGIAKDGYYLVVLCSHKKQHFKVHQLVAIAFLNHKPCGLKLVVNHKDFNKLNNNIENLEIVTQRENSNKKHLKSSSKYTGVCWDKGAKKWLSSIKINKKQIHLGHFINELEAKEYYDNALKAFNEGKEIIVKKAIFSSQYKGITYDKDNYKWRASILKNGKKINVGRFKTELEAYLARENKLKELNEL